jgi:hypothetical protein
MSSSNRNFSGKTNYKKNINIRPESNYTTTTNNTNYTNLKNDNSKYKNEFVNTVYEPKNIKNIDKLYNDIELYDKITKPPTAKIEVPPRIVKIIKNNKSVDEEIYNNPWKYPFLFKPPPQSKPSRLMTIIINEFYPLNLMQPSFRYRNIHSKYVP